MADLDADLYGDLYGHEEAPVAPEQEETVSLESPQETQQEAPPPPTKQPVKPTPAPAAPTVPATSSIPSYSSPPTHQIPTYEERQTAEFAGPSDAGHDGGFEGDYEDGADGDRPVRPSEMKEEGKMFIGGLNWDTTDEGLKKYFTQFGKVEACTIMRDPAGRSRCFAFLTFEEPQSVNAVMVREHFLDGKIIDPKRAIPRSEHQRATKLFIGGLAGTVTSESMREYFSQFGKVVDATVMLDRETGRSKGFGFVSFENVNVEPMLGFGNLEIDGKLIDVKLAQPRSQREQFAENTVGNTGGGGRAYNNNNGAAYSNGGGAYSAPGGQQGAAGNAAGSNFDPQALAQLYTRMIAQIGGMNQMMGGGMNPMMAGGGYGMGGGMRGMGIGMGGMGGMGMGAGMGRGMMHGGGPGPNVPRGPRNAPTGPSGGVGPQRAPRGQHAYHPYAR